MTEIACRERIVDAIFQRLNGALADAMGSAVVVERERLDPITSDDGDFVALFEGDQSPEPNFAGEDGYQLPITVQGLAWDETPAKAAARRARLEGMVARVLRGPGSDLTLGLGVRDIALDPEPRPLALQPQSERPCAAFSLTFVVSYATAEGDPFTFA